MTKKTKKTEAAAQAEAALEIARHSAHCDLEELLYTTMSRIEVIRLGLMGLREAREAGGHSLVSLELIASEAVDALHEGPQMLREATGQEDA